MNPSLIQTYNNLNQNNQFNYNNQNRKGMNFISVSQEDLNQAKVNGGGLIPIEIFKILIMICLLLLI